MKRLLYFLAILITFITLNEADAQEDARSLRYKGALTKERTVRRILSMGYTEPSLSSNYDVIYYKLDLEPKPYLELLYGTVTMRAKVVSDELNLVELNLSHPMVVTSVKQNNNELEFNHDDNLLRITPDSTYYQNELFEIIIEYHGRPMATGFGSFNFDWYDSQPMVWTLSEPYGARDWWPCKDYPVDKADSVDILVTVPDDLIVASNGLLIEKRQLPDSKAQFVWHERYPITTYLVSLAIHPYMQYSDWYISLDKKPMEIQYYVFPDQFNFWQRHYSKTPRMIEIFAQLYGEYPFLKEKYGHAQCLFSGGMEHQTITSLISSTYYSDKTYEDLIAHELAHMWWGDMITCKTFHDIWLNEGFAVYSEALYREQRYGKEDFHNQINASEYKGPGTIYVEHPENGVFTSHNVPLVYDKAAFVLHMMRHMLGDSTFFNILKTYYADTRYQYNVASTADFQELCEQVSGMDLNFFFQQWIFNQGYPQYEVSWNYFESTPGNYVVKGHIRQTQMTGTLFKMPVDITIKMGATDTTFVFWVDSEINLFEFNVLQQPTNLVLDEENWLMEDTKYLTAPQLEVVFSKAIELTGDVDGYPGPNETAQVIVQLLNTGAGITGLTAVLSANEPAVTVTKSESSFGIVNSYQQSGNYSDPFELTLSSEFTPRIVSAELALTGDNNYQKNIPAKLRIGKPQILVVEDDGISDFNVAFSVIFDKADILTESVAADSMAGQNISVQDFSIVIWDTDADSAETITHEDQQTISAFLENGGRFALFGQNIGYDLVTFGDDTDQAFYRDVLNAVFVSDNSQSIFLRGIPGDDVGQGLVLEMRNDDMQPLVDSPDVITPTDSSISFIQYLPSQASAAVRYANDNSKVAYFGFGLNALSARAEENGKKLLSNLIDWFQKTETGLSSQMDAQEKPMDYALHQNYPNPFVGEGGATGRGTTIELSLPKTTDVEVTIYNLLGQRVRQIVHTTKNAGIHKFIWNGLDDANKELVSGVYFVIMKTPEFKSSRKILMVK